MRLRRCSCVRELQRGVPRRALGDELAVLHDLAGPVEAERADDPPVAGRTATTNWRSAYEPCATCRSASADTTPTVWILRSYWSDQTNGTGANGSARLRRRRAGGARACTPCSVALVQCSSRISCAVEQRVRPARDVAGRDDAGRGEARLVAHDAVVEREPGAFEPLRLGHDADTDHHDVGVDRRCRRRAARARRARRLRSPRPARRCGGRRRGRGACRRSPRRARGRARAPSAAAAPRARSRRARVRGTSPRPRRR